MLIAFDTETWPIQPGLPVPRLACGSFAGQLSNGKLWAQAYLADSTLLILRRYLIGTNNIIGLTIPFDILSSTRHCPSFEPSSVCDSRDMLALWVEALDAGRVHDVAIRQRLIDIASGEGCYGRKYSMQELAMRHLGMDLSAEKGPNSWRMRYHELESTPVTEWPASAREYAENDARVTLQIYLSQCAAPPHWLTDEASQVRHAATLALISAWGLRTNAARLEALEHSLQVKVGSINDALRLYGIMRTNGTKDKKKIQSLVSEAYKARGEEAPLTDKKHVSTSAETLITAGTDLLLAFGATVKPKWHLDNTCKTLRSGLVYPISTRYTVPMETGRSSSSGPPLQNLARKGGYREVFEPRPGFVYAIVDYSQQELCALAQIWYWLFGHSSMRDRIIQGVDLHLYLASIFLGQPLESLTKEKDGLARQFCKKGNFTLPVGGGPRTLWEIMRHDIAAGDLDPSLSSKTVEDCRALQKAWKKAWSEAVLYFDWIQRTIETTGGTIVQFVSRRVRGRCSFTEAGNTLFQGLAADASMQAGWNIQKECYLDRHSPLYGSRLVIFAHDEYVAECPADMAPEAAERMAWIMARTMEQYTPDVPIKAEPVLSMVWGKSAKQIYCEGRLACTAPPLVNGWT